jgi:tetratricopeptide (TPR) repeat protein
MRQWLIALVLSLTLAIPSSAQVEQRANPGLTALVQGIDDRQNERPLNLSRLDADVSIAGTLAETSITASFTNPANQPVEGRFRLALPKGSIVTGYALDVGGEIIDGVLLDQPKAREVYTDKVRRGIDPGLGEVSRDAVFTTRVFPIFPGSGRTIRVRFVTPIDPREGFVLPLESAAPVPEVAVRVRATQVSAPPRVQLAGANLAWAETSRGSAAETRLSNVRLGTLRVAPPQPAAALLYTSHSSGEGFFQLTDAAPAAAQRLRPSRIRIYWDRSRSRLDDSLEAEAALVRRLIESLDPQATDIVQFGSSAPIITPVAGGREAEALLRNVRYRGATSFENLSRLTLAPAELCVIFTDGISTIERRDPLRPGCVLHAVTSAADADLPYLGAIAAASGGEAMRLGSGGSEVLDRLRRVGAAIVGITSEAGEPIEYGIVESGEGSLRAVGRVPTSGGLVVTLASAGQTLTRRYPAPQSESAHNGAAALWASSRIATNAGDPAQAPAFKAMAQRYSVAGPEMAFVVLETPYDYVQDEVAPPETYPKRLLASYEQAKTEFDRRKLAERAQWQNELVRRWNEQKNWWAAKHDPNAKPRPRQNKGDLPAPPSAPLPPPPPPPPPPPIVAQSARAAPQSGNVAGAEAADASSIVLTGARAGAPRAPRTQIELAPWRPDRPYLRALEAAAPQDQDRIFLAQEKQHGTVPAFYLDVSDWLFKRGRKAEAVETLLSALDLPTSNNDTIGIVAHRLLRWGELDRAIYLYERLAIAEEFRPQPKRHLALALGRRAALRSRDLARADLDRALALFEDVIETPQQGDYAGIEIISLMEANNLLARYQHVGGTRRPLDPRLIALLDVDLRIILEWNSGNNDLDLWVTEPTGERASYSNQLTRIGGRMSNDMTSGYGPEEYLVRRAVPGTYAVSANVYATDRIDPNGAPVVTARLVRDFGRATQSEEVMEIELPPEERGQKPVGRFVVGKR